MRVFLLVALMTTALAAPVTADEWVNPYLRSDGTSVQGYWRSEPDGNIFNNYSTKGNVNPYTGEAGTVDPYGSSSGGFNWYGD